MKTIEEMKIMGQNEELDYDNLLNVWGFHDINTIDYFIDLLNKNDKYITHNSSSFTLDDYDNLLDYLNALKDKGFTYVDYKNDYSDDYLNKFKGVDKDDIKLLNRYLSNYLMED